MQRGSQRLWRLLLVASLTVGMGACGEDDDGLMPLSVGEDGRLIVRDDAEDGSGRAEPPAPSEDRAPASATTSDGGAMPSDELTEDEPAADVQTTDEDVGDQVDASDVDRIIGTIFDQESALLAQILARDPGDGLHDEEHQVLETLFVGHRLYSITTDFDALARDADNRAAFFPVDDMTDATWSTEMMLEQHDRCIIAIGAYDLTGRVPDPDTSDYPYIVSLSPPDEPSSPRNDTGWLIRDLNPVQSGGEAVPHTSWSAIDYEATIETTCDRWEIP